MFVGETGILRVVERTGELMAETKKDHPDDVRKLGGIDLPTMQRYLNLWYSLSLDLFGGEISLERGELLRVGPQGPREGGAVRGPHARSTGTYAMDVAEGRQASSSEDVPLRNAMNEVLRDEYVEDCQRGVDKWNRAIEAHGIAFELTLPSRRFHRHIGIYAGRRTSIPQGNLAHEGGVGGRRRTSGSRATPTRRS